MTAAARIASQLEPRFNEALAARLGEPVLAVERGVPPRLPDGVRFLVAAPITSVRDPAPDHWPHRVEWIQLLTSGVDLYPDWFFSNVRVTTARGVAADSIAEYCIGAVFDHARSFASQWVHSPADWQIRWSESIAGQRLGILGYGAIARALAGKAQALGMSVSVVRKTRSRIDPDADGIRFLPDVAELAARSDHLVLAAPLTAETRHLIDARALSGAVNLHLINIARGELIVEQDLLDALRDGRVARATLDVTAPEPLPAGHVFYSHPSIRISPHTSAISWRTRQNLIEKFAANLQRLESGQPLLDEHLVSTAIRQDRAAGH